MEKKHSAATSILYDFLSNMRQVTIQNNLDTVFTWFKTIDINFKWFLVGKMDCYWNFIWLSFPPRKNKPVKGKENYK